MLSQGGEKMGRVHSDLTGHTIEALIDTSILIDHLGGFGEAKKELARYERRAISVISWMEVMAGVTAANDARIRAWLGSFDLIPVDDQVADRAIEIRKKTDMRWPDAIVLASAQVHALLLVSRNTKAFPENAPNVRIPYRP
jgi:predicted nucleic acid-binding protein